MRFGLTFVAALVILLSPGRLLAADWGRWRGPELNGISQETNWTTQWPAEGPIQLWKVFVGIGFSSVSTGGDHVYTMGNADGNDTVFCLKTDSGKVVWKHTYPCGLRPQYYEGGTSATPTAEGDRVYTLGKEGQLFCFNAATGHILWQTNVTEATGAPLPRWAFASSPLIEGDLLLLNAGAAGAALDKNSGRPVWTSEKKAAGYATPVPISLDGQRCALVFAAKALVCVRISDGHEFWQFPWVTKWDLNIADPIVAGDKVFISSFDQGGALLQVTTSGAKEVWRTKEMANHFSTCVLSDGHLYGFHGNTDKPPAELRCLDWVTGELKWKQAGLGFGALTMAGNRLIILSEKGELVVANARPTGFKPLARAQVLGGKCWIAPVLSNGRVYCRNAQGSLVCLDVSKAQESQAQRAQ